MHQSRLYRNGAVASENFDVARTGELLAEEDAFAWLHLEAPDGADLDLLSSALGVSRLAAAELVRTGQRTKITRHDSYVVMTVYLTHVDPKTAELRTSELGVAASDRWLVTLPRTGSLDADELRHTWDESPDLAVHGVAFLVHGLLERAVDSHFDAVQQIDDALDAVEADLFADQVRNGGVPVRSYAVRKALVGLRRVALPMREILLAFTRRDLHFMDDDMIPYFADVYEQVLRITEWTETLRDLVTTLQDSALQIQNNLINEVMRQLSAWAAIFAASTAITGFYGMNVLYPQINSAVGAITASSLLILVTVALIIFFRAKRWL